MDTEEYIYDITSRINATITYSELKKIITDSCYNLNIDNFIFGSAILKQNAHPSIQVINGYPTEWRKRYEEKNYVHNDLTVQHCKHKNTPILWSKNITNITSIQERIFLEASEFDMNFGISFPYHGIGCEYGIFSACTEQISNKSEISNPLVQYHLQILGSALFDSIRSKISKPVMLTRREQECLKWVASGKTSWEISKILVISERTVIFHIQNAASKMGTTSRTNATVSAILSGLISL